MSARSAVGAVVLILLVVSGSAWGKQNDPEPAEGPQRLAAALSNIAPDSGQLLLALPLRPRSSRGMLYAFDRSGNGWALHGGPVMIMAGRNGFAQPGEKREGDGKNPAGLFPLEFAFGYAPAISSRMPYRQATNDDLWVDDVNAAEYNQWVKRGQTGASSFEEMKLPDNRYRHGLVIGYNRNPVVKGHGSAIFAHVWREEGNATAGCIAMAETDLTALLAWLDPAKKPVILMGDPVDLAPLPGLSRLVAAVPAREPLPNERLVLEKIADTTDRQVEYVTTDGFAGAATTLPQRVVAGMLRSGSWRKECPVSLNDLSYLVLTYWGFDNKAHVGELVVHRKLALTVVKAFAEFYAMKFPLERMELIDTFDGNDDASMAANNSSVFNCRDVPAKPGVFSRHSYGVAIDINPLQNPYLFTRGDALKKRGWNGAGEPVDFIRSLGYSDSAPVVSYCRRNSRDCRVLPPESLPYLDRSVQHAGMLRREERPVTVFTDRGFFWGANWLNDPDFQHFDFDMKNFQP